MVCVCLMVFVQWVCLMGCVVGVSDRVYGGSV